MNDYISKQNLYEAIRLTAQRSSLGEMRVPEVSGKEICSIITDMPPSDVISISEMAEILDEAFGHKCPCTVNDRIYNKLINACEYRNSCKYETVKGWEQFIRRYMLLKRREEQNGIS